MKAVNKFIMRLALFVVVDVLQLVIVFQGGRFPIKWMAIESLLDGISTTKSDV